MRIDDNRSEWITKLLIIACVVCNISQIPVFWENRLISAIYTAAWVLLFILAFFRQPNYEVVLSTCKFAILFDLFCFLMFLINGSGYISSALFRPINLSAFVMIVGIFTGKYIDDDRLKRLMRYFVASVMIFAVYVYINYFRGVDWAGSGAYVYTAKNSAGQILLTAIIILLVFFVREHKAVSWGLILVLGALIFMMKSRAVIVTLAVVVIYFLFFYVNNLALKLLGILISAAVIWIALADEQTYNLLINQILLNNKDVNDFTAVSSYRDLHYESFGKLFPENTFVGTGGTYLEAMPLAALLSYGLIGGVPVLLFSLYPLYMGIKKMRSNSDQKQLCHFIITLGLSMVVNGFFEEQAPFGPGVKCFFLWLMTGFLIGRTLGKQGVNTLNDEHGKDQGFVYSPRL